jgi:hypothetical protein
MILKNRLERQAQLESSTTKTIAAKHRTAAGLRNSLGRFEFVSPLRFAD